MGLLNQRAGAKPLYIVSIIFFLAGLMVLFIAGRNSKMFSLKSKNSASPDSNAAASHKERPPTEYQKLQAEHQRLKDDYARLHKDMDNISLDRDNLINQAKSLLGDRSRANELEGLLSLTRKDKEAFEKEKDEAIKQRLELEEKYQKLDTEAGRLQNEKRKVEDMLAKERDKSRIRALEQDKLTLQKENNELKSSLKQAQSEASRYKAISEKAKKDFERSSQESDSLSRKVDVLNKGYSEAIKKNRELEQKIINTPAKFVEIGRQNKTLIKETANMHYNLGVFYTKNKEYSRAVAEFEKALELRPDDDYAHFNLGYIYAEYLVERPKAIEHFRQFLRLTKSTDKDVDWVKKYILTWQSWAGKEPAE